MAIAFDATSSSLAGGTSVTISHTCTGSDRLLLVFAVCQNSSDFIVGATVTYNGVSLGSPIVSNTSNSNLRAHCWKLIAPATGANNLVFTPTSSASMHVLAASFTGVDQTTPVSATANAGDAFFVTTKTTNITVGTGGMAVDFFSRRVASETLTPDGTQTQIGTTSSNGVGSSAMSYKAAPASSMTWTFGASNAGVTLITALAPVAGAPGTSALSGSALTGGAGTASGGISITL